MALWIGCGQSLLALHNLSREPAMATLDLTQYQCDHLIDLLDDQQPSPVEEGCFETRLPGYGYRWYRLGRPVASSTTGQDADTARSNGKVSRRARASAAR